MGEVVYVVVGMDQCYGVFTDESLANDIARYNNAIVSQQVLVRSRQENWQIEYEKQTGGR